jgi:hypothetical protein
MQLVAYGAQDIYLTGNPQITFFKVVYRRHTNFSMESIEQTFNGSADFGKKVTCTISRNGDLIHRVYLQVTLPRIELNGSCDQFRWLNWIGHALINYVEVEIGGQRIDRQYGQWLHIWNELTQEAGLQVGYANMVGNVPRLTQIMSGSSVVTHQPPQGLDNCNTSGCIPEFTLYVPLQFWFCRNPGLSLPLIALQYHEVKINLQFNDARQVYWASSDSSYANQAPCLRSASLYVDYIYLDTDERRRFAQVSHEYLIEQLQFTGSESVNSTSNKIKLNFNHPVKELIWVVQPNSNTDLISTYPYGGPQHFNFTDSIDISYFSGTPDDPFGGGMIDPKDFDLGLANQAVNLDTYWDQCDGSWLGDVGGRPKNAGKYARTAKNTFGPASKVVSPQNSGTECSENGFPYAKDGACEGLPGSSDGCGARACNKEYIDLDEACCIDKCDPHPSANCLKEQGLYDKYKQAQNQYGGSFSGPGYIKSRNPACGGWMSNSCKRPSQVNTLGNTKYNPGFYQNVLGGRCPTTCDHPWRCNNEPLGITSWYGLVNAAGTPLFDRGQNPVLTAKIQLNGHDRFSERDGRYFNLVQPFQHHTNIPATGINVYSFGLKPEEHQPSGTCNMSRIDNCTLHLNLTPTTVEHGRSAQVYVYATNYNVLRIMSGMGGLAYSN